MKKELHLGVIFTGKLDDSFRKAINTIKGELGDLAKTIDKVGDAQARQTEGLNPLKKHLNAYIDNIKKLIYWQAQWYGAKAVLFASLGIPTAVIASTVKYSAAIDEARANLLRWEATSGKVTKEMVAQNEKLLMAIRTATTEYPIAFSELAKAAEAFLGANVKVDTVTDMIPMIAQLKTSFKEIDFEQFAISTTGAFNVFRDTLVKSGKEVIGFQALFEKLMLAQKEGIIRPEEFTKVIQYMGQMSKLAGFNVDQMLALSVAVTNTGQKATSAARLLQGLFQSFSTKTTVKHLNEFAEAAGKAGIKVDKSKTLASQFYDIIGQLGKLLNPDGTLNIGAAQFMNLLTSSDRSRILQTLIPHLSEAIKLAEKLKDSAGNLQTVSDIMKKPIGAQWQIFKNILNEMTVSINGDTIPALQAITGWLVDVARGALYALDPTDRFKGKLDNLGEAGRSAYENIKTLVAILKGLWGLIGPLVIGIGGLIKAFLELANWLMKNTYFFEVLTAYLSGKFIIAIINSITNTIKLSAAFKALSGVLSVQMLTSFTAFITGLTGLGKVILAFISGPLGMLTIALSALMFHFYSLGKEMDKLANRRADFNKEIEALQDVADINAIILDKKQQIAALEKKAIKRDVTEDYGFSGEYALYGIATNADDPTIRIKELKSEIELLEKRRTEINSQKPLPKAEKPPTIAPPSGADKDLRAQYDKSFSSYNAELTAAMQAERSYYQTRLALLENMLKLGVISEEKYYAAKAALREKDLDLEQKAINEAGAQLEKDEEVQIRLASKKYGANSEFVKALKAKFEAERDKLNTKEVQLKNKRTVEESGDLTEKQLKDREENLKSIKEANDQELSLAKIAAEQKLDILEQERTMADRNLRDGLINESQYYKEIERIIIASYETRQKLRDLEYEAQKKVLDQELIDAGQVVERINEVRRKQADLQRKHNEETVKADLAKNQELIKNNQAAADDLEVIWQEHYDGFNRLVKKAITDSIVQWKKWGSTIYKATQDTLNAMKDQFSNFFEDFLNGELKTAEDYFAAFGKSINKILADVMAQKTMEILFGNVLGFGTTSKSSGGETTGEKGEASGTILGTAGAAIGGIFGEEGAKVGQSIGDKIGGFFGLGTSKTTGEIAKDMAVNNLVANNLIINGSSSETQVLGDYLEEGATPEEKSADSWYSKAKDWIFGSKEENSFDVDSDLATGEDIEIPTLKTDYDWLKDAEDETSDWLDTAQSETSDWLDTASDSTTGWLSGAWDSTKNWFSGLFSGSDGWLSSLTGGTDGWLSQLVSGTGNWLSSLWQAVSGLFSGGGAVNYSHNGAGSSGLIGSLIGIGTSLIGGFSGGGASSEPSYNTSYDSSSLTSGSTFGDWEYKHSGGLIMHSGGLVPRIVNSMVSQGLKSDERRIIGQVGERMLSRDQNKIFEKLASFLDNSQAGSYFNTTVPFTIESNKAEISKQVASVLRGEIEQTVRKVIKEVY